MPKIQQLSAHVANLIAAGEVVERPASVVKELLENAVDAGASKVTIEIRDGGMTFLRVTDNGCGMEPQDAATAFLRHATSKLRTADDLAAIGTMGFRGEALAAIASVSRIDLMTKTPGSLTGTSLTLEAGKILERSEVGCPDGTTIIIRDLFFNTPARMKFMKSDTVEASRISAAVQLQALAHPEVAIQLIRDGKSVLSTPGTGGLQAAVYCVYGRDFAKMLPVDSRWENYHISGFVCKPTDARPSRSLQTFFVNDRPVRSKLMMSALEEAYRNQIMVGKFPACVLHLTLPAAAVDVNVHPAKTEVKFLREKEVFDCIHYGVLAALNKAVDRPQLQFKPQSTQTPPAAPVEKTPPAPGKEPFFRTMTPQEFKTFSAALKDAPRPDPKAAAATVEKLSTLPLKEQVLIPKAAEPAKGPSLPERKPLPPETPQQQSLTLPEAPAEPQQQTLPMPRELPWRMVGELYNAYVIVEQGEEAFLIDKHAAHERILFEKLRAQPDTVSSQTLLQPIPVRLTPAGAAVLLEEKALLEELGFALEEFGESTLLVRQVPMELLPDSAGETLETLAADLLSGRRDSRSALRDELLHTVACKAAIKAGWLNDRRELLALVEQVMQRQELKYCPHGRPICITLSKKQLEKQFKRS